jgi:hypothetical protein
MCENKYTRRWNILIFVNGLYILIFQALAQYDDQTFETQHVHNRHNHNGKERLFAVTEFIDNLVDYHMNVSNGCNGLYRSPCVCTQTSIECINAQYTDSDLFLTVAVHFPYLERATYKGNNFRNLPAAIFGHVMNGMQRLEMLNISSNYIVQLHAEALLGVPNLQVLDMSDNEIYLRGNETYFFTHTPYLKKLIWRRALNANLNRSKQVDHLINMLRAANLKHLEHLDISMNGLTHLPYDFGCFLPALKYLNLQANYLTTLHLNSSCLKNIDTLDIRFNEIINIDSQFRTTASSMNDYSILAYNRYLCDCNSSTFITWFKTTKKIQDPEAIVYVLIKYMIFEHFSNICSCFRTSPRQFDHMKMLEIDVKQLDCSTNLTSTANTNYKTTLWSLAGCIASCLIIY